MAEENRGTNKRYPYDELRYDLKNFGSLTDDERRRFGRAEMNRCIRNGAALGALIFVIGAVFIIWALAERDEEGASAVLYFGVAVAVVGFLVGLIRSLRARLKGVAALAGQGVSRANKKLKNAHALTASRMQKEMDDGGRPIYEEFYREWKALRERGVYPDTFVKGYRFRGCTPVDILVDGVNGKMAVCSYYTADVLAVYDTALIRGCELTNNDAVVYGTAVNDNGGTGVVKGPGRFGGDTTRRRIAWYKVTVRYDDPKEPKTVFEFGTSENLAKGVFNAFVAIMRRNDGFGDVSGEDVFGDL